MAQRVITQKVSDLSGVDIADGEGKTVNFSVEGVEYQLDLTQKEFDKFNSAMDFYITHATRVGGRKKSGAASKSDYDAKLVRAWAVEQGLDIPSRGRIPSELVEQYKAAH